ncbi:MAG: RHS repeat protein, partial [Herbaspirillum sp.]|uniref:hypothetical protein n=1 Tax=Herbaspirillum sp. TaxID=1890675 RepID=UPI00258E7FE6
RVAESEEANVVEEYDHNGEGQLETYYDGKHLPWNTTYDGYGRLKTIGSPLGHYESREYNDNGLLTKIRSVGVEDETELLLAERTLVYDGLSRVLFDVRTLLPEIEEQEIAFATTQFEYHLLELQTVTIDPRSNEAKQTVDRAGRTTSVEDAEGNTTEYEYLAENIVIQREKAGDGTTLTEITLTYDGMGRLISVVDGAGEETIYTYDVRG